MHIDANAALIIGLAILAHAWSGRVTGSPPLIAFVAWFVTIVALLVFVVSLVLALR